MKKHLAFCFLMVCSGFLLSGCLGLGSRLMNPDQGKAERQAAIERRQAAQQKADEKRAAQEEAALLRNSAGTQDILVPAMKTINDRMYAYEQKVNALQTIQAQAPSLHLTADEQKSLDMCTKEIQNLLIKYTDLHKRLLAKESLKVREVLASDSLLGLSAEDIAFLEGDCAAMAMPGYWSTRKQSTMGQEGQPALRPDMAEQEYRQLYARGEYDPLIARYETEMKQGVSPTHGTMFQYGQSLLKTGKEEKARSVFEGLLDRIQQQGEEDWGFRLRQLLGDIEFGLGRYTEARKHYQRMQKEYANVAEKNTWAQQQIAALGRVKAKAEGVQPYALLLNRYLTYSPTRDGYTLVQEAEAFIRDYPASVATPNAKKILEAAKRRADGWFMPLAKKIDSLEAQKRFKEGLDLLNTIPVTKLPRASQVAMEEQAQRLAMAQGLSQEKERLAMAQESGDEWNRALRHLEAKEYDEAIALFSGLQNSPSYGEKAKTRMEEAARLAASENRTKAGELFARANRTDNMENRIQLLLSSRTLLQETLTKYPHSGLTEKIQRNLNSIEQKLRGIDPALLTTPNPANEVIPSA